MPDKTKITNSQIGVIGDNAHVEGSIHFYGRPPDYYAPFQPSPLPPHFIPHPEMSQPLKVHLLADSEITPSTLVISAIYGLGGIGKSTLAAALARDADVSACFPDGVLWATLGQEPDTLSLLSEWIQALGDYNYKPTIVAGASAHLRTLLNDKAVLLVIDDAWDAKHVHPFCVGGPRCRALVTTREGLIARAVGATLYDLDVMTSDQALALLAAWLGRDLAEGAERSSALALAEAVGYLPLALELSAAQVADGAPWAELLENLRQEMARLESLDDLAADQVRDEGLYKRFSLCASFQLNLRRMSNERRARFAWLGVLPKDVSLTSAMCATLWDTQSREARRTLRYLQNKALLQRGTPRPDGTPTYRIHDLLHDLARHLLTAPAVPPQPIDLPGLGLTLPQAHATLLARYRTQTHAGQWHTLSPDGYIHAHLAWHLEKAGQGQELHALLREESAGGSNGWYEVREGLGQTAGYVQDMKRAWRLADSEADWGLGIRYALITASINNLAMNLPVPLLVRLVQVGVWLPAQGLIYACQMPGIQQQTQALAELAEHLTEGLARKALAAVRTLEHEGSRAKVLTRLSPHLPEELFGEALAATYTMESEWWQAEALAGLASHLPEKLVGEALAAARAIKREAWRAGVLAGLVPHLPEKLVREALAAARATESGWSQSQAMLKLAPHLPDELLEEALAVARAIESKEKRAQTLTGLAPYLPERLLQEALASARAIECGWRQAEALAGLALYLPETECNAALVEALAVARAIETQNERAYALAELATHLPEAERDAVLAEALAAARAVESENERAYVLAGLAPYLPVVLVREASAAARAIKDEPSRAYALARLTTHLPGELLEEALAAAYAIDEKWRRVQALAGLAPHLPVALVREALAAACTIEDKWDQVQTLAGLAVHLPEDVAGQIPAEALAAACAIEHEWEQIDALVELAPHLPEDLLNKALIAACAVEPEMYQAQALAGLAPHLSEGLLEEALVTARAIKFEGSRFQALVGLTPHLPERLLEKALATVRAIERAEWRAEALAKLAVHFPERVIGEALTDASIVESEGKRAKLLVMLAPYMPERLFEKALAVARTVESENDRALALAGLATRFPDRLLKKALIATRAIGSKYDRAKVLTILAPYLSETERDVTIAKVLAMVRTINYEGWRADALVALALHLRGDMLEEALALVCDFEFDGWRAEALTGLVPRLAELSPSDLTSLWQEMLPLLVRRTRRGLLSDLRTLLPILVALGGVDAVAETFRAIQDVGRWWP